jgi:hemolysin activation/secretion protein
VEQRFTAPERKQLWPQASLHTQWPGPGTQGGAAFDAFYATHVETIGDEGLIGTFVGSVTHGQPGSTLTAFNVLTDSWAFGPRLTYPLIRNRGETLLLDGGFTVQDARVAILGAGFSHDKWRVLDIGGSYQRAHVLGGVCTDTFDVAQGLPFLDASPNRVGGFPNLMLSRFGGATDFTKINAFTRLALPLVDALSVVVSAQGQFSFSRLITGEQITFGGTQIGRGYDPGALTGDHGLGGSAELRYDFHFADSFVRSLQPYTYFDAARTWYIRRGLAGPIALRDQSIASVGGGVRVWLPYNVKASAEAAQTLVAVPGSDAGRRATKVLVDLSVRF